MTETTPLQDPANPIDKALAALKGTTADQRRGIYVQLRHSLSDALDILDPPLTLREKLGRQKLLEERIVLIERAALADLFGTPLLPVRETDPTPTPLAPAEEEVADIDGADHGFEETVVRVSLAKQTADA